MKKFLNLLSDELHRSRGFYFILLAGVVISQLLNALFLIFRTLQAEDSEAGYRGKLYVTSFFDDSSLYGLIIGGAIMALLLYSVLTWMREWYFQGKFIYRLLTLPGSRIWIPIAKLASIILMIGGLLFAQLILIWLIDALAGYFLPLTIYVDRPWFYQFAQSMPIIYLLMPMTVSTTFLLYGTGIGLLLMIFNAQIYFYSQQSSGSVKALLKISLYLILCFLYLFSLIWLTFFMNFLPQEIFWLLIGGVGVFIAFNSYILSYLMSNKISV